MQSDTPLSDNTIVDSFGEIKCNLDLKRSSTPQLSFRTGKGKVIGIQGKKSAKHGDNSKSKHGINQSYGYLAHELKQCSNDGICVQPKTSENRLQKALKLKRRKDDELVKYMSSLPGYLQQMGRGENIQGKALNVGVLDWSRLEKWKGDRKCIGAGATDNVSLVNGNFLSMVGTSVPKASSAVHSGGPPCRREKPPSLCSSLSSSHNSHSSRDAKSSIHNTMRFKDSGFSSKKNVSGRDKGPWTYKSFGSNNSGTVLDQGKRKDLDRKDASKVENWSSNSKHNGLPVRSKENMSACKGEAKVRVEEKQESDVKSTVSDQKIDASMGSSSQKMRNHSSSPNMRNHTSSKMRKHYFSLISKEEERVSGEIKEGLEELQESAIHLSSQQKHGQNKNIVLLLPRKVTGNSSPESLKTSMEKNVKSMDSNNLSGSLLQKEEHPSTVFSDFPHSCPLPVEANAGPHKMSHIMSNTKEAELQYDVPDASLQYLIKKPSTLVTSACIQNSSKGAHGDAVEAPKMLDQETAKQAVGRSRPPSPNHRFSFSLSRMTRSFSSKESSAIPQLSSTYSSVKSGPVMSGASVHLDDSSTEKARGHNRARSSPFRRLLDPLLKSKGSNPPQSAEVQGIQSNALSFQPVSSNVPLQNEKNGTSGKHAVLQVTVKNGLPLFHLVVDSNSSILAAPMKNLSSHGENESGYNYTFYAVDEIKKRSVSWINQGSKEKNCGFVYNMLGQMRVSSSSFFGLNIQKAISHCIVNEAVLFGVEQRHGDQASPRFMPNRELAAVVLKTPGENLSLETNKSDEDAQVSSCCGPEYELCNSVTAILPGGTHGLPSQGVPSPLINRWKSGGSCDCGGWDVGCKLRVLSNEHQWCNSPRKSKSSLTSKCLDLFVQGGGQHDKPIFRLAPLEKGVFSVQFDPEISLLQAFFIAVTVISCQKSSDLTLSNMSGEKNFQDPRIVIDGTKKSHATFQRETPVKYTPNPPLSPVGRV